MTFGQRLRRVIALRGYTQTELAAKGLGTQKQISEWVNDAVVPGLEVLTRIIDTLDVNGHWLLTGEGDAFSRPGEAEQILSQIREMLSPLVDGSRPAEASVLAAQASEVASRQPPVPRKKKAAGGRKGRK